ncbi:class A rhodopsin-like G-protein coupled receptor GPRnna12, putative [Pediculus humanus corporis]|uniref:Class A rhodopsin-like G-protein coupled receptor GPRnna12, putative n=1 Tax=Pediculus humanus subsp. corporis TaxID=121224 RepID=E0V9A1_PEDHC|nr:class A rhodopsin-like G-protein coupled receptor GPRnna12, putative [Pediculus humanus corporis]EEB09957.1 class A rhodopsin-like G-protein coupled receptor GPRnna12, putative [Pediculus humanus corporis]
MLVIVVVLFALCWLPLQAYNVLQDVFPEINKYRYINIVWFCFDWLAMSNSCYNPFIYGIYNEKFKREFQIRFPVLRAHGSSSSTYYSSENNLEMRRIPGQSPIQTKVTIKLSKRDIDYGRKKNFGR